MDAYVEEASAAKGCLSELLLPAGFVQIGRSDAGGFDAICFDLNEQLRTVSIESCRSITTTFSAIGRFEFRESSGRHSSNSSKAHLRHPTPRFTEKTNRVAGSKSPFRPLTGSANFSASATACLQQIVKVRPLLRRIAVPLVLLFGNEMTFPTVILAIF
jgi:hypothetical protein